MESELVYSIKDWAETFENSKSRTYKTLTWVALPSNFNSNGYQRLLDHFGDDASRIYGVWCALSAFAAQCPVRGKLADSKKRPILLSHISRTTGLPIQDFEDLIAWATRPEVGWLIVENNKQTKSEKCQETSKAGPRPQHGPDPALQDQIKAPARSLNRIELNGTSNSVISDENDTDCLFEEFWKNYPKPRKRDKAKAKRAWSKAILRKPPDQIIKAVIEYSQSDLGSGDYSKLPVTWLNGECWDDDRSAWSDDKKASKQSNPQYKSLNRRSRTK